MLGFPGFAALPPKKQVELRALVENTTELPLDEQVIERAVTLRQQKRMKLGDAIIAATALEYVLPLVTRNTDDFKHIAGLELRNPFATTP